MATRPSVFRPGGERTRSEARAEADQIRGSAAKRGYTYRWSLAARSFRRLHPLCLGCQAVGVVEATVLVDHVVPHKGDDDLFWSEGNWQPSCRWHHDVVKQRLEGDYTAGRLKAADLRLDSMAAAALTRRLRGD